MYKILSKKKAWNWFKKKCTKYCQKKNMKLVRWIFLVLCTKYCQKRKRQEDMNEIGAMHFFRWYLLD